MGVHSDGGYRTRAEDKVVNKIEATMLYHVYLNVIYSREKNFLSFCNKTFHSRGSNWYATESVYNSVNCYPTAAPEIIIRHIPQINKIMSTIPTRYRTNTIQKTGHPCDQRWRRRWDKKEESSKYEIHTESKTSPAWSSPCERSL